MRTVASTRRARRGRSPGARRFRENRHCEERRDEAIQSRTAFLDFASLATTDLDSFQRSCRAPSTAASSAADASRAIGKFRGMTEGGMARLRRVDVDHIRHAARPRREYGDTRGKIDALENRMRDEHDSRAQLRGQRQQIVVEFEPRDLVQRREGFVHQE